MGGTLGKPSESEILTCFITFNSEIYRLLFEPQSQVQFWLFNFKFGLTPESLIIENDV